MKNGNSSFFGRFFYFQIFQCSVNARVKDTTVLFIQWDQNVIGADPFHCFANNLKKKKHLRYFFAFNDNWKIGFGNEQHTFYQLVLSVILYSVKEKNA